MAAIIIALVFYAVPIVMFALYVYLTRKVEDITVGVLLIMLLVAIIPVGNIIVLLALLCHIYDFGNIFTKVLLKQKGTK